MPAKRAHRSKNPTLRFVTGRQFAALRMRTFPRLGGTWPRREIALRKLCSAALWLRVGFATGQLLVETGDVTVVYRRVEKRLRAAACGLAQSGPQIWRLHQPSQCRSKSLGITGRAENARFVGDHLAVAFDIAGDGRSLAATA